MHLLQAVFLALLAASVSAQYPSRPKPANPKIPEVDQRCMDCLCQASSDCDETIKCHNAGGNSYFCGPYVISWAYWHDGGRPGDKGRAHDFENCLTNKTCAEEAVRGYMRKYGQDCDSNGVIDCQDFARIHKLGFGQCGGDAILDTDYWQKFEVCYIAPFQPYDDYGEGGIQARSGQHPPYE
ncbi:lysozyme [Caerostris darwini]|uniref:lysozyme n=1 Tax=Caerostris darwini TaxID=1538125 RepID=A0AAV4P7B6_9ARAC|nr:lysozyme [Caerostris darwini]